MDQRSDIKNKRLENRKSTKKEGLLKPFFEI